ncbi:MAG: prolipoprotein diacylglyceryl transferase, partial [Crocinitomix sp.]|nr:prolipoprotein diacylglyceryl transferase [Crocinitomix sp.]
MSIPFEPIFFGWHLNVHLVLEYLAFLVGFRYYMVLRKKSIDQISSANRISIILGAILGAFIGSRLVGFLENPTITLDLQNMLNLLNTKSIIGGLVGGLIGVEIAKKIIKEKNSSGDLFTFPIIIGIIIGRIGCFLSGINEFTYGVETKFFMGMDLGDGLTRHPTALYEIIFLCILFILLKRSKNITRIENGLLFKIFMVLYVGFRFFIEFLKPNIFYLMGLSS